MTQIKKCKYCDFTPPLFAGAELKSYELREIGTGVRVHLNLDDPGAVLVVEFIHKNKIVDTYFIDVDNCPWCGRKITKR